MITFIFQDCRRFLNAYNAAFGRYRLVYTFPCLTASVGELQLIKPKVSLWAYSFFSLVLIFSLILLCVYLHCGSLFLSILKSSLIAFLFYISVTFYIVHSFISYAHFLMHKLGFRLGFLVHNLQFHRLQTMKSYGLTSIQLAAPFLFSTKWSIHRQK